MADQSKSETGNGQMRRGSEKGIEVDLNSPGESLGVETSTTGEGFANHPHMSGEARLGEKSPGADYFNMAREYGGRAYAGVSQVMRDLPQRSRTFARGVDVQVRSNPWLATAAVGVGAMVIGYLFGRSMRSQALPLRPSAMGLGYDDFDEAIDE